VRELLQVDPGTPLDLAARPADERFGWDREEAEAATVRRAERLAELGTELAADGRRALLAVFQGLDASGKDGAIKRCIGPLNPMMVRTQGFTAPAGEELRHDFLWRIHAALPGRGRIGAFNRSHYEDVLVPRVELGRPASVWEPRIAAITAFERHLVQEGTVVLKFFLHVSREEQAERLRARIEDPHKRWKFDAADLAKRALYDDYLAAYADLLRRTSTPWAPWHVVPADRKWVRNRVVTEVMVETLEALDLRWSDLSPEVLKAARAQE
jgi:PPK2 family polyphosphate:nucleotide phosphotransferase